MVYFKQTSGWQQVRIPASGLEADGIAALSLSSTISGEPVAGWDVEVVHGTAYHDLRLALPDGMLQGEYVYRLRQGDALVACGVAVVGEYTRIAPAETGKVENINIRRYGE